MITPEDLQNKNFSRVVRGYNPIEVDDYLKFLMAKFEQLHKENADLEKRLHIVSGKYEELANEEEAIRNAVTQAKKLSESMVRSAEKAAEEIIEKVKTRCDNIIEDAQIKVEAEAMHLAEIRMQAAKFKQLLIEEYSKYLRTVREVAIPSPDEVLAEFPALKSIGAIALDDILTDEIITRAAVAPSKDPELEEFKRFVRPEKKSAAPDQREEVERSLSSDKPTSHRITEAVFESNVDVEDPNDPKSEEELLAETPDLSVKDALHASDDTAFSSSDNSTEENPS